MHAQNQVHQPRQPGYDENIIGEQLCSRPAVQRPLHSRRLRELDDDIHSIRPATTQSHFDLDLHDEEGMGIFDVYQYLPPYPGNRGNDGYVTSNKQIDPSLLQLHRQPRQQPDPVLGQQRPGTVAIHQPVHQSRRIGDKGYAIGQELLGRTAPNQFHQPGQQQSVEAEYDANGAATARSQVRHHRQSGNGGYSNGEGILGCTAPGQSRQASQQIAIGFGGRPL